MQEEKNRKKEKKWKGVNTFTSWPLLEETLLAILIDFVSNLQKELALIMSFLVVLRICMVPYTYKECCAKRNLHLQREKGIGA